MLGGQETHLTTLKEPSIQKQIKIQSKQTYEEAKTELITETTPKDGGRLMTLEQSIANTRKIQEFNNRWKEKKPEKNLQEALFDVYVERNLRTKE